MIKQDELAITSFGTHDFEMIREAEKGWDQRYDLLGSGGFEGKITVLQIGDLQLSDVYWGSRIKYRGISPPDSIAVGLPIMQSGTGKWLGLETSTNDLLVQRPGVPGEFISPGRWRTLVLSVASGCFLEKYSVLTGQCVAPDELPHGMLTLAASEASILRQDAVKLFNLLTFRDGVAEDNLRRLAQNLEAQLVLSIARVASSDWSSPDNSAADRIVKKVEDYVASIKHRPISIIELCQVCEISERTLHMAFQRKLGITPASYIRTQRLNQVYKTLRIADPTWGKIKDAALENGFSHLGHFTTQYKKLFGELPSATLRRT